MQDWVCSTLFSVPRGHILIFFPKSQTQIVNDQILDICRVLCIHYLYHDLAHVAGWEQ